MSKIIFKDKENNILFEAVANNLIPRHGDLIKINSINEDKNFRVFDIIFNYNNNEVSPTVIIVLETFKINK